ncbi:hypothetical protein MPC4_250037 [Methylocella tundrae]|uniref:Uncharacterized protein n=1 Tax=Methylocella tundrae TaxID=227605 RepID=A0A8B6M675_METTU|nr:hypothetical protein MPC4_250037 [Methylocella tundrae]
MHACLIRPSAGEPFQASDAQVELAEENDGHGHGAEGLRGRHSRRCPWNICERGCRQD